LCSFVIKQYRCLLRFTTLVEAVDRCRGVVLDSVGAHRAPSDVRVGGGPYRQDPHAVQLALGIQRAVVKERRVFDVVFEVVIPPLEERPQRRKIRDSERARGEMAPDTEQTSAFE
jgi:hypothetical protein